MTEQQKGKIMELRGQGYGYKRIAKELSIAVSTVRYICAQPKETGIHGVCLNCGAVTTSVPHKKAKKFCSDKCRWEWHNARRREEHSGQRNG